MARLIKRFTGSAISHLSGVDNLDIMSDDFNLAEAHAFTLNYLAENGFTSSATPYYVEIQCSDKTPGITMKVRDTDIFVTIDEKDAAEQIVSKLSDSQASLWASDYIYHYAQVLGDMHAATLLEKEKNLYQGCHFDYPAIYINDVPIMIARKARSYTADDEERAIILEDTVSILENMTGNTPMQLRMSSTNYVWTIDNIRAVHNTDTKISYVTAGKVSSVQPKEQITGSIPADIFNASDEEVKAFLRQKSIIQEDNTFDDIDLF